MSTQNPYGAPQPDQPAQQPSPGGSAFPGDPQQYPGGQQYSGGQQFSPGGQTYPGDPHQYAGEPVYSGGFQQQAGYGGYQGGLQPYGTQPGVSVGFVEAVKRYYAKYAQFSGRASRSEYWWVVLFMVVVMVPLMVLVSVAGTDPYGEGELNGFGILLTLVLVVFLLGNIVPSIAIAVRRLHDANLSGWLYLLNFIPYVGGIVLIVLTVLPSKPEGARFDR